MSYRLGIFVLTGIVIVSVWGWLIMLPSYNRDQYILKQVKLIQKDDQQLQDKNQQILDQIGLSSTQHLIDSHAQLRADINKMNDKLKRFHLLALDETTVIKRLNELLHETDALHVVSLHAYIEKTAILLEKKTTKAAQSDSGLLHFQLSIRGDYFSIASFLKRAEELDWQIFWKTLVYKVDIYPMAIATIEFYVLKPVATMNGEPS